MLAHRATHRAAVRDVIRDFNKRNKQEIIRAPERAYRMVFSDADDDDAYVQMGGDLSDDEEIATIDRSWRGLIHEYRVKGSVPASDLEIHPVQSISAYLHHRYDSIVKLLRRSLRMHAMVRVQIRLTLKMRLPHMTKAEPRHFSSFTVPVLGVGDIPGVLRTLFHQLEEQVDEFVNKGSGWKMINVDYATVMVSKFEPNEFVGVAPSGDIAAGSFIPLPDWVHNKKATCNPQNKYDELCFHYCMELALAAKTDDPRWSVKDRDRDVIKHFPFADASFVYSNEEWPMQTRFLDNFERDNAEHNVGVCVLGVGEAIEHGLHWVRPSPKMKDLDAWLIHLLVLFNAKTQAHHYVLVKPGKLKALFTIGAAGTGISNSGQQDVCERCLMVGGGATMRAHREYGWCMRQPAIKTVFPAPGQNYQYFKDYAKMQECDFYISADFECFLRPVLDSERVLHEHYPSQFGIYVHATFSDYHQYITMRAPTDGVDIGAYFVTELEMLGSKLVKMLQGPEFNHDIDMSPEQEAAHKAATECYLCSLPFVGGHHPFWKHAKAPREKYSFQCIGEDVEAGLESDEELWVEEEDCDETTPAHVKVADHDHRKPRHNYRGAAHQACNLQFRKGWKKGKPTRQWMIPVFFHNLKGYDSHIIIGSLNKDHHLKSLRVIPQQGESFLSFEFSNFRFIDSVSFLQGSLDNAIATQLKSITLPNGSIDVSRIPEAFPHTTRQFEQPSRHSASPELEPIMHTDPRFLLLLRKGIFPYEYMDSAERFAETELPPREAFRSSLDGKMKSKEAYAHAQRVWEAFNIQTLGQYQDLYMKMDTVQSADCMHKVITTCRKAYRGLDPGQYISAPSLSYAANLLMKPNVRNPLTGFTEPFMLELCDDSLNGRAIYEFCEANKRGGITNVPGRYAAAGDDSDISYVDATNLYGWAMSQKLPVRDFEMWPEKQIMDLRTEDLQATLLAMDCEGSKGWWVTVDIEVPQELHDFTADYPLFPVRRSVSLAETSPYYKSVIASVLGKDGKPSLKHDEKTEKLVLDLHPKKKYSIHLKHLQFALRLGAVVTALHQVLEFTQSAWMADYIQKNTNLRNSAADDASKAFFKLMNNACYGKTLQDDRKHRDVRPVVHEKEMRRALRDPLTSDIKLIRGNDDPRVHPLAMVERVRKNVKLDKPLLVGITILELSKLRMYTFYYHMKRLLRNDMRLLMTDTDSLIMHIKRRLRPDGSYERWEERLVEDGLQDELDFSVYPVDHPAVQLLLSKGLNPKKMKGIVGSMKNEYPTDPIAKFVGLRPKMYSIVTASDKVTKKAKGVNKYVMDREHDFASYEACLRANPDWAIARHNMVGIHSKDQRLRTDVVVKQTLSPLDSKRFMVDAVTTLPYGHYSIAAVVSDQTRKRAHESLVEDAERTWKRQCGPLASGVKSEVDDIRFRCPRHTAGCTLREDGLRDYLPQTKEPETLCCCAGPTACVGCHLHSLVFPPAPLLVGVEENPGPKESRRRRGRAPKPHVPGDGKAQRRLNDWYVYQRYRWYKFSEPSPPCPREMLEAALADGAAVIEAIHAMDDSDIPHSKQSSKDWWREDKTKKVREAMEGVVEELELYYPSPVPTDSPAPLR